MSRMILIRGLPGTGKSTLARKIARNTGAVHCEADDYFIHNGEYVFDPTALPAAHDACQQKAIQALNAGRDVVVANTFSTRREMAPYKEAAARCGAEVVVITMVTEYGSIHGVPSHIIERMRARWEP